LTWNSPVYEQFFEAIRAVNLTLPKERKIRVILADAPILWRKITTRQQWLGFAGRRREEALAARIVDILSEHRRALVISAPSHLFRNTATVTARDLVEKAHPGQSCSILPQGRLGIGDTYKLIEAREAQVPAQSISAVADSWMGGIPIGAVRESAGGSSPRLQDVVEALLYVGPSDQLTALRPSAFIFRDEEYWIELNRRWRVIYGEPFDLAKSGFDQRGPLTDVTSAISEDTQTRQRPTRDIAEASISAPAGINPTDGPDFVFKMLERYPMVGLGDMHMCVEFHQFLQKLIRDPRLPKRVNDIVVEFGNPLYQAIIDRYVVNGEQVSLDERKPAWQQAAMGWYVANSPVYERFFDTVRDVNLLLPREKRIRVILGDFAVDVQKFRADPEQYLQQFAARETAQDPREISLADSVNKVLAQGHRGIMICGNGHLRMTASAGNARHLIEEASPGKFYLIDQNGPGHPSWPLQSIVTSPDDPEPNHATLWLGPAESLTGERPSPLIYRDADYWVTINLFEELVRHRSPFDLAAPSFAYRGRYFEASSSTARNSGVERFLDTTGAREVETASGAPGLKEFLIEPGSPGGKHSVGPGEITAESISLRELISFAYGFPPARVLGPDWINDKFHVVSKARDGDENHFLEALQKALAGRLSLRVQRANKELAVYVLKITNEGLVKSHQGQGSANGSFSTTNGSLSAVNAPMAQVDTFLSWAFGRPVIDETGLTGGYTVELQWQARDLKALAQKLRENLGLELIEDRREVPVLIVVR
jgi:uncharacterized protein (TIGR03435 family)